MIIIFKKKIIKHLIENKNGLSNGQSVFVLYYK